MDLKAFCHRAWKWAGVALFAAVNLTPASAFAQMCPMCYNAAASSKAGALQALRSGTLILMIPPLALFAAVFVFVYRKRDRFNGEELVNAEVEREFELFRAKAEFLRDSERGVETTSTRPSYPAA